MSAECVVGDIMERLSKARASLNLDTQYKELIKYFEKAMNGSCENYSVLEISTGILATYNEEHCDPRNYQAGAEEYWKMLGHLSGELRKIYSNHQECYGAFESPKAEQPISIHPKSMQPESIMLESIKPGSIDAVVGRDLTPDDVKDWT